MDTDSITISHDSNDLVSGPFSVSLKINNTSVMLYRNRYIARNGEQPGASTQQLLCSFSVRKTEIPADFHSQLIRATTGQPRRYEQLMQTLKTRVLEPARRRQQEREHLEQLTRIRDWVDFAHQQIQQAASYDYRNTHLADPEIQQRVQLLLKDAQRLLVQPKAIKMEAAPGSPSAEQRLQQLLENINNDLAQVQAIMPMAGEQFGRGYEFSSYTVQQVQQFWFNTSDTIAVFNQRRQLKRPNHWSEMRQEVMQSASQKATEVLVSAPEQEPPGNEISLGGITGEE